MITSAVAADPYTAFRRLHADGPVHWSEELGAYLIVGFDEAAAVLRSPGWSSDPRRASLASAEMLDLAPGVLLFMDPPHHSRLRRLLSGAFTPRAIERLRPRVASVVEVALNAMSGTADILAELGHIVPLAVISELLDVGTEGAELFRAETPRLVRMLETDARPEDLVAAGDAVAELGMFLLPIFVERRRNPGDDFISALLAVADDEDRLTLEEVMATCVLLLAAGHETTANLIGNGALTLLRHPEQRRHLFADPERAVEELLRYESPVQLARRIARVDHQVGGRRICAGQQVLVLLGAANRDPRRFTDPDLLNLGRPGPPHLAFGGGAHFCLGAALARLEGAETLVRLFTRFPHLTLGLEPPRWRSSTTFRGLYELPVRLS